MRIRKSGRHNSGEERRVTADVKKEEERNDGSGAEARVFSIMCMFSGLGAVLEVEADTKSYVLKRRMIGRKW